jgi:hypothetical protein
MIFFVDRLKEPTQNVSSFSVDRLRRLAPIMKADFFISVKIIDHHHKKYIRVTTNHFF